MDRQRNKTEQLLKDSSEKTLAPQKETDTV